MNNKKNLIMFCLSMDPNHLELIRDLGYMPVGLGLKQFNSNWFQDKTESNISKKNNFYGEYTFHYWLWKNYLNKIEEKWIGFCNIENFFLKKIISKTLLFYANENFA